MIGLSIFIKRKIRAILLLILWPIKPLFFLQAVFFSKLYCLLFLFSLRPHYLPRLSHAADFEVFTIAFNDPLLIKYQIKMSKKYFSKDQALVVADNSSNKEARRQILQLCMSYGVKYIDLPRLPQRLFPESFSHGLALNWLYRKYILKSSQLRYFGFIDHDVFPIKAISNMKKILDRQKVYGYTINADKYWFLWPGLCFYKLDYLRERHVDFQLVVVYKNKCEKLIFDTGSANIRTLYTEDLSRLLEFSCEHTYYMLRKKKNNSFKESFLSQNIVEVFGDFEWLHLIRSSCGLSLDKREILENIDDLKRILKNKINLPRFQYKAIVCRGIIGYWQIVWSQAPFEMCWESNS